ncbi:hypothetical protein Droror1_Dr00024153, partial [Drosera rotundifolia]
HKSLSTAPIPPLLFSSFAAASVFSHSFPAAAIINPRCLSFLRRPLITTLAPPSSPHLCHRHTLLTTPPPHLNPPATARLLFLTFSSLQFPSLAAFSPLHREEEWL